jgi:hypothetical protein
MSSPILYAPYLSKRPFRALLSGSLLELFQLRSFDRSALVSSSLPTRQRLEGAPLIWQRSHRDRWAFDEKRVGSKEPRTVLATGLRPSYRLGYIGTQHGSDARFISAGLLGLVEEVEGLAFALTSARSLR